jgi:hypothetical protein
MIPKHHEQEERGSERFPHRPKVRLARSKPFGFPAKDIRVLRTHRRVAGENHDSTTDSWTALRELKPLGTLERGRILRGGYVPATLLPTEASL